MDGSGDREVALTKWLFEHFEDAYYSNLSSGDL